MTTNAQPTKGLPGLMQAPPLQIIDILKYAASAHSGVEVVSRLVEEPSAEVLPMPDLVPEALEPESREEEEPSRDVEERSDQTLVSRLRARASKRSCAFTSSSAVRERETAWTGGVVRVRSMVCRSEPS